MPISSFQFADIGPKFPVDGPYGSTGFAQPSFKPGTVTDGDGGAEFIFLLTDVVAGYTANQGDAYVWDASFVANRCSETTASGDYLAGTSVGTLFLGGQAGEGWIPGQGGYPFTYAFAIGRYGIWVQRAGGSLAWVNSVAQPIVPRTMSTTAVAGRITFATATGSGYNLIAPGTIMLNPLTRAFTADLLTGTNTALNASSARSLNVGMRLTGTGIPGPTSAPTTYITAIDGSTITMSAAPTASGTGVTITASWGITSGSTVSGSPLLTNIPTIYGLYPNQTITGTGIPASTHISAISGASPSYTILLDANATATSTTPILLTATTAAVPNYTEVMLEWPYFSGDTVP